MAQKCYNINNLKQVKMTTEQRVQKIIVLIDMLENYNNVKNDWYIEKIVKELKETIYQ